MGETTDLVGIELVHRASPAPRDEWEEGLRADPLALETQSAAWTDALGASAWAAGAPPQAIAVPKRAHVLDLEGGFESIWSKRFTQATRTRVRKAEREGVAVECDTSGRLVPDFYELMTGAVARWASRQHE